MVEMQSARLKRAGVARHLLEARDFSRVRLHFIASKPDEKIYVQVTESMISDDVRQRELAPLQRISDNYEKIILSMNTGMDASYEGIKSINLCDWLLGD